MRRTAESLAVEVQMERGLSLSERQFQVLCSAIRSAGDPEARARELSVMSRRELMSLIGERNV